MLRFRAPGSTLGAAALVARVLGVGEARAAGRIRGGALATRGADGSVGARLLEPDARVAPGTALCLAADPPAEARAGAGASWEALAPALPWRTGRAAGFAYETRAERDGVAHLRLHLAGASLDRVRGWLAEAGAPVLGDLVYGGIAVAGGLRLAPCEGPEAAAPVTDALCWPDEPVFPPGAPAPEATLRISAATARVLARGHPWVIADRETEPGDRFAPGTLVMLRDAQGRSHGLARTEGTPELAARVWSLPEDRGLHAASPAKPGAQRGPARPRLAGAERSPERRAESIEARVARALARRRALLGAGAGTDAVRLVHGEADALPGLAVDRLGPLLRVLVTGRAALALRERVVAALLAAKLPDLASDPPVVEVMNLRARPPGELACVRLVGGSADAVPDLLLVREGALRFRVECGLAEPARPRPGVGFFLDQRENRARVAALAARGGRYLNLFAHTGGFSAALLAGGADEVWSVDLSAPYLAQLDENLARSGLPLERHRSARREARRFLAEWSEAERFAGVVLDPPIAAASGRRFWSTRRDLAPLAVRALRLLEPGGFLLLTRQERAGRGRLGAVVRAAAAQAGVELAVLEDAPPGGDFPPLAGFPEGAPFEAVLAIRA